MGSYPATVARLAILAVLLLLALGSARVLIELWIEQRQKRRLAATRDISALEPSDFERYVAILFEADGYRVRRTGGSGDRGVDIVVQQGGTRSIVQCKRYEEAIGPSIVRELIGALTNAGLKEGYLVTTSDFTAGAEREARKSPYKISLIDGDTLARWARTYGLPGDLMNQG
ncbi:MAG: restriction endonuclease [Anaerolineae bacterium]|jgi:restriction system protein